jgi:hypothetical protein
MTPDGIRGLKNIHCWNVGGCRLSAKVEHNVPESCSAKAGGNFQVAKRIYEFKKAKYSGSRFKKGCKDYAEASERIVGPGN